MKIDHKLKKFLIGKEFSNGYQLKLEAKHKEQRRENLIISIIKNKRIIHLGCLDHIPLIEEKIKNRTWLHGLITDEAKYCLGIDINKKGIDEVSEKLHIDNMIFGDIIKDDITEITNTDKWDYIVLGEILEHINNPVNFLQTIREKYKNHINQILITVPNVLTLSSFKHLKNNFEVINSDHRYWFTPYTILKVLFEAGYNVSEIEFANRIPLSYRKLIIRKIKNKLGIDVEYPFSYFSTIVVTAII